MTLEQRMGLIRIHGGLLEAEVALREMYRAMGIDDTPEEYPEE